MGKKLRSRQILDQTDQEIENQDKGYPIIATLGKNILKKTICSRLSKKNTELSKKSSKYFEILKKGQICSIIDESKLQCPICLELMVRPTMLSCGHMFCYRCLESNAAHSQKCCMCRQEQNKEPFISSCFAQKLISEVILPRSNDIIKYLCRTTDAFQWAKRREIGSIRPGVIVDFKDSFNVWRRAIVLKTFIQKDQFMLNIKMNIKGSEAFETIEARSKRLAPSNFFTRGKYLEEFPPILPQFDIYEKELNELEYRQYENSQELFFRQQNSQNFGDQPLQQDYQRVDQNFVDQALALFDWEMNGAELQY